MTLFKQINSLLFGLFLLVMTSLVYFQFTQTRDFMEDQMTSELNNTMTSLGLILQPHLETGDLATAETLINVVFESGFYRKVTLTWLADEQVKTWQNPVVLKEVPQWFTSLALFTGKSQETIITSGWLQLAKLEIESHPGHGYQELWRIMNNTLMVLSFLFLLSIVLVRIRLHYILLPLKGISEQAQAISQRRFTQLLTLPKTRELKTVVEAINTMSTQLKTMFSTLDNEVSELKEDKLVDRVSSLPNRQYLSAQLNNWLNEPGYGGLILAKFEALDEAHKKHGYQGRDNLVAQLGARMQADLPEVTTSIMARISHNEFAFVLTKAEHHQIELYLQALIRLVNQEISKAGLLPNEGIAFGVSERIENMTPADFLAQSDNALQQAIRTNQVSIWVDSKQEQKYSRTQWREKLTSAISNQQFVFQTQPVKGLVNNEILQQEVYCRLMVDGQLTRAAEFMPFIDMFSLGGELDQCLLTSLEQQGVFTKLSQPMAINLTLDSILSEDFADWLTNYLAQNQYAENLLFEFSESILTHHIDACLSLMTLIKSKGAKVGIDQCGRQIASLDYLTIVQPDYIKLDQSFAYYEKAEQSSQLCRSLVNVANSLNIQVVLTGIEDEQQLAHFKHLHAYGYQGYISPPQELK